MPTRLHSPCVVRSTESGIPAIIAGWGDPDAEVAADGEHVRLEARRPDAEGRPGHAGPRAHPSLVCTDAAAALGVDPYDLYFWECACHHRPRSSGNRILCSVLPSDCSG